MMNLKSLAAYEQACAYMPGGVNSPVRAFGGVDVKPLFIARARGARIFDIDGNEYIDYVGSWGPMILGHAHPAVLAAIHKAVDRGTSFGAPTEAETELAARIIGAFPSIDKLRLLCSGTEAVMTAIRLARAYTGRDLIVKMAGCYHGHSDSLLVAAGSGLAERGTPASPGVPEALANLTIVVPYNDSEAVRQAFEKHAGKIAAVLVEPVAANMGVVPPLPGYLETLRRLCDDDDALLIFDEVITGFRIALGGAQERYAVAADMTCLGKIVGGGLPAAAYGGKREILELVSPAGPVYQAGTLSGNPLAMAAGIVQLDLLKQPGVYERLESLTATLCEGIGAAARDAGVRVYQTRVGSMFTTFFTPTVVVDETTAKTSDTAAFAVFFRSLLEQGIYTAPSQFEAGFISLAHSDADIAQTVAAARVAMRLVAEYQRAR